MLDDLVLEIEAGVIAADMDFHIPILSQRKTPPDKSGGVSLTDRKELHVGIASYYAFEV